jgi:hypothetical protein
MSTDNRQFLFAATFLASLGAIANAQQHTMPPGVTHDEHLQQMQKDEELKRRGLAAMGFDQDSASHHFILEPRGGRIVVMAQRSGDAATVEQIKAHLREIAASFAAGVFDKPFATHGELPPGAALMAERKEAITYRFEDSNLGGAVVIRTDDVSVLEAVHQFLRYQIIEHKTGDRLTVSGV